MHCKTALAQAEVEYEEQRTPSVYVKFPLVAPLPGLPAGARGRAWSIWTTTPWTLPANLAIAVHPDEEYVALEAAGRPDDVLIVAAKLADAVVGVARLGERAPAWRRSPAAQLDGLEYRHAWIDRTGKVGDAPTSSRWTRAPGSSTSRPGHGEEDYDLGRALGLRIYNPVDDDGRFMAEVEHFAGQTVWEANPQIIAHLRERGALVAEVPLDAHLSALLALQEPHAVPRHRAVVHRARQGRAARSAALDAIRHEVRWIPRLGRGAHLQHGRAPPRLDALAPARVGRADRRVLLRGLRRPAAGASASSSTWPRIFGEGSGADEWYVRADGGAAAARHALPEVRRRASSARRRTSSTCGSTPAAATRPCWRRGPSCAGRRSSISRAPTSTAAGSTRSLLEAMATRGAPPYRAVLTHGFVVDGEGRKMSKSRRQRASRPTSRCAKYGAEVLRLWVAAEDYTEDIRLVDEILDRLADAYRRIRNTFRFLLGNLDGLRSRARPAALRAASTEVDRFVLDRLARLIDRVRAGVRGVPVPHGLPHRAQLLRGGPVGALPRRHQGPALHLRRRTTRAGARRRRRATTCLVRARAADGADPDVHDRGGVAPPARYATPRACTWSGSPRCRSSGSTTRLKREWDRLLEVRREVAKALEMARARKLDRQRARGVGPDRERARGPAGACCAPSATCCRRCSSSRAWSWRARADRPPCGYESQEIPGLVIDVDRAPGRQVRALLDAQPLGGPRTRRIPASASAAWPSSAR